MTPEWLSLLAFIGGFIGIPIGACLTVRACQWILARPVSCSWTHKDPVCSECYEVEAQEDKDEWMHITGCVLCGKDLM